MAWNESPGPWRSGDTEAGLWMGHAWLGEVALAGGRFGVWGLGCVQAHESPGSEDGTPRKVDGCGKQSTLGGIGPPKS